MAAIDCIGHNLPVAIARGTCSHTGEPISDPRRDEHRLVRFYVRRLRNPHGPVVMTRSATSRGRLLLSASLRWLRHLPSRSHTASTGGLLVRALAWRSALSDFRNPRGMVSLKRWRTRSSIEPPLKDAAGAMLQSRPTEYKTFRRRLDVYGVNTWAT